jgi:hypothetical protein
MILDAFGALVFGALGWLALEFLGRPIQEFFDLRRRIRTEMLKFERVSLPMHGNEDDIISRRPPITAVRNQDSLRELSAELISFGQSEWLAAKVLARYGFDPVLAGQQLSTLASEAGTTADGRSASYRAVLEALKFPVHRWRDRG